MSFSSTLARGHGGRKVKCLFDAIWRSCTWGDARRSAIMAYRHRDSEGELYGLQTCSQLES